MICRNACIPLIYALLRLPGEPDLPALHNDAGRVFWQIEGPDLLIPVRDGPDIAVYGCKRAGYESEIHFAGNAMISLMPIKCTAQRTPVEQITNHRLGSITEFDGLVYLFHKRCYIVSLRVYGLRGRSW